MKHIKTLSTRDLKKSMKKGGCGECQTSCQSACKTSCTVGTRVAKILNKTVVFLKQRVTPLLIIRQRTIY